MNLVMQISPNFLRGQPILEQPFVKEIKYHTQINKSNSYGPAYVTN
jgi:hypothetical protein